MKAFVVNNVENEKRMDLIMQRANTWFKKTSLFSTVYLITSPPNDILLNIEVAEQLMKRINTTTIRVCNHCGFQWEQDRTDEEMDKLFADHTETKKEDIYHSHPHPDWTDWTSFKEDKPNYRKLKVKLLLNMGLEFPTKNTPTTEETEKRMQRTVRNDKEELHDWCQRKQQEFKQWCRNHGIFGYRKLPKDIQRRIWKEYRLADGAWFGPQKN